MTSGPILPVNTADLDLARRARGEPLHHPDHRGFERIFDAKDGSEAHRQRLLAALGIGNARTLHSGAKRVTLRLRDGAISTAPLEHKRGSHLTGLRAPPLTLPADAPSDPGAAVRDGLALSR